MEIKKLMIETYNRALESHIPNDRDDIREFFKKILDRRYDCIVFISRRCYILFQMYIVIEGGKYDNTCTDLGMFAKRELLKTSKHVLIVDDIGYTGKSMQRVSGRLALYIPPECKLDAVLYAANKRYLSNISEIKLEGERKINIKAYTELTNRQCQELSVQLVSTILEAGIPYITFVYPTWGRVKRNFTEDYKDLINGYQNSLFKECKWKTFILNLEKEKKKWWTDLVGDYSCVRIYKNQTDDVSYFLPFVFLKRLETDKINEWYSLIADAFEKSGADMIAEEIREILKVDETWRAEAIEYLSCMLSCFCSKSITEILGLRQYVEEVAAGYSDAFCDSFSQTFVHILKECDKSFAEKFWDDFRNLVPQTANFFAETSGLNQPYFDALYTYLEKHANVKNVYDISYKMFEWIKSEESDSFFAEADRKYLKLEDMVYFLENRFGFEKEQIYLAQVECWDIGIATYRFHFDKERGIIAICNAGEMSSVINQIKYQELIKAFYNRKYRYEDRVTDQMCREIIKEMIKEEAVKDKYTPRELDDFEEIAEEQDYSFYDMFI